MTADPTGGGADGHTHGYGIRRVQTRACPLGAGPAEEESVSMFTAIPSAKASELHRSQRALVAASLLACPPVSGGKHKRA
jgi:hypothetical protein